MSACTRLLFLAYPFLATAVIRMPITDAIYPYLARLVDGILLMAAREGQADALTAQAKMVVSLVDPKG